MFIILWRTMYLTFNSSLVDAQVFIWLPIFKAMINNFGQLAHRTYQSFHFYLSMSYLPHIVILEIILYCIFPNTSQANLKQYPSTMPATFFSFSTYLFSARLF